MLAKNFWPDPNAFIPFNKSDVISDKSVRCTGLAVCNKEGVPVPHFHQQEEAHFFYEFEILEAIGMPGSGIEIALQSGLVVHGKNSFLDGESSIKIPVPRTYIRYHQTISIELQPGEYILSLLLASVNENSLMAYRDSKINFQQFNGFLREHCRVRNALKFTVLFPKSGRMSFYGLANLSNSFEVELEKSSCVEKLPLLSSCGTIDDNSSGSDSQLPTIFHVTHWKAGSQWIRSILSQCVPEQIVNPQHRSSQFLKWPVGQGRIYPTLYVTKREFDGVKLPDNWYRCVIIRDLRDTLISGYFSIKYTHKVIAPILAKWRELLTTLSDEEGLIFLMDEWLPDSARIQLSWSESGAEIIRYEDLIEDDLEILENVLLNKCQLPITKEFFRTVVMNNRFEALTNGRRRGEEDSKAHVRKGIAGDWRNHFTSKVKDAFKIRFGGLLIATGYESDFNW